MTVRSCPVTADMVCSSQLLCSPPSSTSMLEGVEMGGSEKRVVFAYVYVQSKIMCKFLTVQLNFYMQH